MCFPVFGPVGVGILLGYDVLSGFEEHLGFPENYCSRATYLGYFGLLLQ